MKLFDDNGRVFGRVNVLDLTLALILAAAVAAAYVWLTSGGRVAAPFPVAGNIVWTDVTLRPPADASWLAPYLLPGQEQIDPRSNEPVAQVLSTELKEGRLVVHLKLRALRDAQGRLVYGDSLLVPGRQLRIETNSFTLEGLVDVVRTIQ